jgi:Leucine Rich Repeat (LRR) protein
MSRTIARRLRPDLAQSPFVTVRWLQFSLRTLLAAMLGACCLLGWVAYERGQAAQQRAAYELIVAKGGATNFGPESTRSPWVRWIVGEDIVCERGCIEFSQSGLTDADLAKLSSLSQIDRLSLNENPITDQGLVYLSKLRHLRYLSLDESSITDDGLASLRACQSLQVLSVGRTRTTTAGVQRLRADLPNLNVIDASEQDWPPLKMKN